MNFEEKINALLNSYAVALDEKSEAQRAYDTEYSAVYLSGRIDGKNAETRKAQETEFLSLSAVALDKISNVVKVIEAQIGLYKAAWYAMSGGEYAQHWS